VRVLSYAGVAMPGFVVAILLLLLFGYVWQIIPVFGRLSPGVKPPAHITGLYVLDGILTGRFSVAWDAFLHLSIPAVSLALGGMFQDARLVRNAMVENSSKDYLAAMKGYGVPEKDHCEQISVKALPDSGRILHGYGYRLSDGKRVSD